MRHVRYLLSLGIVAAVLALAAVPAYGDNGNSSNAQACQQNGWQSWMRTDGTHFTDVGSCVSYAAQGGTLTPVVGNPGT